ncbi:MAG TPA: beta-propeller fold lactonase family protein [Streptosporangiaceae bacterium]|nr:beta-propeller fold lactonase family protein [Streptosporangiaceae bacterium]
MKPISKLASATAAAAAVALLALPASAATTNAWPGPALHPVFVQTDNTAGNTIVAYEPTASGGLQQVGSFPTGGDGGQLTGSVVDHLSSEGSLSYDRQAGLLYAVNAGSNTITVFRVIGDTLIRSQVISSGGQFPVSIAVYGNQVFVLNALGGASVSGFTQFGGYLIPVPFWHRDLGLGTTASTVFTGTPGEIGFTPDGSHIVVTTKGAANTVEVFQAGPFGLSAEPTITSLPGAVPFGFTFDQYGHLALAETHTDTIATFSIAPDGALTQLGSAATGQVATCWITAAPDGTLYASNAGSATESALSTQPDGAVTLLGNTPTDAGTVDAAASSDGQYLYVQAGGPGNIDAYYINPDGSLTETGSVTVPGAVGGEGIVAL